MKLLINHKRLAGASNSAESMQAKKFVNWTSEAFTWKYDGIAYTFNPEETMFLEDYKADHFAKHLVDRELNRMGLPTDRAIERRELTAKCFPSAEIVTPAEALNLNEEVKAKKSKKVEPEFEDLKVKK